VPLRAWCLLTLLASACGGSASTPDGAPIDARPGDGQPIDAANTDGAPIDAAATQIQLSKWPRQTETFQAFSSGAEVPLVHGFQGFNYVELQIRVPASIASPATFDLVYDVTGLGGMDQNSALTLGTPAGGVRDSDRYLIFMNQFDLSQLDGATCHITAHFPTSPQLGIWDGIVTFRYTGCLDNGPDVVCPDGGVP
jgi:hypothetical protein